MNENLDLTKVLKDVPSGTPLYSPIFGDVTLLSIDTENGTPIGVGTGMGSAYFYSDGRYSLNGECLLFPSKNNRDWSTFKAPKPHKHFEPFQKVLVNSEPEWEAELYSHWSVANEIHIMVGENVYRDDEIIPYEGNESLLGKPVE